MAGPTDTELIHQGITLSEPNEVVSDDRFLNSLLFLDEVDVGQSENPRWREVPVSI